MFSLEPFLESRYVVRKTGGSVAVHFISTVATSERTRHTLWLESIPALLDFLLKLLFAKHISSVSLCHPSSLPQLFGPGKMFSQPIAGRSVLDFNIPGGLREITQAPTHAHLHFAHTRWSSMA